MRNIKRIFAMSLATVMLCASMVVGSAASFNDADKIVNTEAVTVTTGLGIFAGTTDGNFNPTGTTTRAQMAAVIVKMLYGADINADQFKGASKFSDVADFEGGWAEGYINLCSNKGIIAGYGDGTFKPSAAVTTAEATTMIINALGVDAGEGTWPLTVMAKAEEMKLFAELAVKPGTNEALTRDTLASVVFEAIKYSPKGNSGYRVDGYPFVFDNIADAFLALGTNKDFSRISEVVGEDSLANTIFKMISVTGYVTANQATGADCTTVGTTDLNIETGLDAIGHYVTAYYSEAYKSDINPGVAYAIVDEADYVIVSEEIDTKKDYREVFGNKDYTTNLGTNVVDGTYTYTDKGTIPYTYGETISVVPGTYVICEGNLVGYIAEPTTTIGRVSRVAKDTITIAGIAPYSNSEDDDVIVEYDGITKDDIVVITTAQEITYLTKADCVIGEITRTSTVDGETVITVGGKSYTAYGEVPATVGLVTAVEFDKNFEIYTYGDKFLGWKNVGSTADVSDVVFVIDTYTIDTVDSYGNTVAKTYAQGINVNGKEVSYLIDVDGIDGLDVTSTVAKGAFYTFDKATDRNAKKYDIMLGIEVEDTLIKAEANGDSFYTASIGEKTFKRDEYVMTIGSETCFITEATKFIVYDGVKSDLEVMTTVGAINRTVTGANVILSENATGNILVEVVVINGTVNITGEDLIYVFDTNGSMTANGFELGVYFTESNSVKNITIDGNVNGGFYTYTYDATENIYELSAAAPAYADSVFTNHFNGYIVATGINGVNAINAKIFDARLETEIKDSDIARIESLEDMIDATNADYEVKFSAITDDEGNIVNIIITSVESKPIVE